MGTRVRITSPAFFSRLLAQFALGLIRGKAPYGEVLSGYACSNHVPRILFTKLFKPPLHHQTMNWEITPEVKTLPRLNNPLLIEGLPGIGNVGKIAVDFLLEELKAVKLYSFFSHKYPHSVFVNDQNLVEIPKIEMYYKKFNGKAQGDKGNQGNKNPENRRDLLLLTGDIQPIDEESCYSFCEEVLKIAKHFNCREIITTGGIGLQYVPEKPKVYSTSNSAILLKDYLETMPIEKKIFGVVGPIVGVSGILLGLGKKRDVPGVALLAETFGHPLYLGVKGAQEILKVLEQKFALGLNLQKMGKEIIRIEQELMKKTKEWAHIAEQAGAKARQKEAGYIG